MTSNEQQAQPQAPDPARTDTLATQGAQPAPSPPSGSGAALVGGLGGTDAAAAARQSGSHGGPGGPNLREMTDAGGAPGAPGGPIDDASAGGSPTAGADAIGATDMRHSGGVRGGHQGASSDKGGATEP
ncbi:MAG: hypothetical protein V4723_12230 [Pseudomonadota bacterium]